jgi:signal recognition particle GTPase
MGFGMEQHGEHRHRNPAAPGAGIAGGGAPEQGGCGHVEHYGDENDCHRASVAQRCDGRARAILRGPKSRHLQGCSPMFESLTQRLSGTIERLRGRGRLSESNISEAVREVRIALLEADVALPVVQALIQRIKVRAVGQEVMRSLTPGQVLMQGSSATS